MNTAHKPGMTVSVYYVDPDKTDKFDRDDAMMGKLLPPDKFATVAIVELPTCFEPRADLKEDWRLSLCETIFTQFQAVDGPVLGVGVSNEPIRSMSVGDVLVIEGEPGLFFCDRIGFVPKEGRLSG